MAAWRGGRRPGRTGRTDRAGDRRRLRGGEPGPPEDAAQEHLVPAEGARRIGRRRSRGRALRVIYPGPSIEWTWGSVHAVLRGAGDLRGRCRPVAAAALLFDR